MQPIIRDYYKLEEIWGDVEIPVESVKKFNQSEIGKRNDHDKVNKDKN